MHYSIYHGNSTKRYALGMRGRKHLIVLGCNPHEATDLKPDATSTKVEHIVGIYRKTVDPLTDGFVLLNLYPTRSKTVCDLPKDGLENACFLDENLRVIERIVKEEERRVTIWGAWGSDIQERRYLMTALARIIRTLTAYDPRWVRFGDLTPVTRQPRHPSRIKYDNGFSDLPVSCYLD